MKANNEYSSTCSSISLAMFNFMMHLCVCFYMTADYPGEHYLYWLFLVLTAMANVLAIIYYIAKSVGPDMQIVGFATRPSEISMKLQEHPNEAMWVVAGAVINTE